MPRKSSLPKPHAIVALLRDQGRALHAREIAARLHVAEGDYSELRRLLDKMSFDGALSPATGQRFKARQGESFERDGKREGTLTANPRGFGFVATAGMPDDLFIPEEAMGGAMHGDLVLARVVTRTTRGLEGEVTKILERASVRVAGVLRRRGRSAWLEPDDTRLRGPIVLSKAAMGNDGEAAVAKITRFPNFPGEVPEGEIEAVLGTPGDPNVEVAKILVREDIREEHPEEAVEEARGFGDKVPEEALYGREDLTGIPLPTIDPEDARDHDDAVWAKREPDGSYTVWIAIADVSHYVTEGSALDEAAIERATSIYLPDRAIPMLPRELSSTLCSLLPGEIRLCLAVEAKVDATGTPTSFRIIEGFMRSSAKLTYAGVARALKFTDAKPRSEEAEAHLEGLETLRDIATLLRARRLRRGALDFDLPEPRVLLDEETGAPVSVERRAEDPGVKKAYRIIEELMLLANELVARYLTERGVPTIYRVHGPPDEEKLERLANACKTLGLSFSIDEAQDPKKLSALLKRTAKLPQAGVLNMLLLRSMKQAAYDIANIGHFGLASEAYLHFTAPIRRYPDIMVHRATRALLQGERIDRSASAKEELQTAATIASAREREVMDVEREVVDLYRALYMRSRIGDELEGTITALVGSGVFVQLDSPFVDVLVKYEALGSDDYSLDDSGLRVTGSRSGEVIALGDRMVVEIEDVAILRRAVYGRRVALIPAHRESAAEPRRKGKSAPKGAAKKSAKKSGPRGEAPKKTIRKTKRK